MQHTQIQVPLPDGPPHQLGPDLSHVRIHRIQGTAQAGIVDFAAGQVQRQTQHTLPQPTVDPAQRLGGQQSIQHQQQHDPAHIDLGFAGTELIDQVAQAQPLEDGIEQRDGAQLERVRVVNGPAYGVG